MDTRHTPNSMDQNGDRIQTTRLQGESLIIPDTLMIRTIKWRIFNYTCMDR